MALIIPPGFAQITQPFKHQLLAREAVITYGIDVASGSVITPTILNAIQAVFNTAWTSFIDSEVTIGPLRASVGQDGGENLAVEGNVTLVGTATAERATASVALLLRKLTTRGGRRGRGRVYLPWMLAEANVTEIGVIPSGGVTAAQTAADAWLTALVGLPDVDAMVLLHSTGNTPTGLPDVVTSLTVDPVLGTQRRRLGRR